MTIRRTSSPLIWKPSDLRESDLKEAIAILEDLRLMTPTLMRSLMHQGYVGLILADRIHKLDDRAREFLGRVVEREEKDV
jgi:hypothetical protein